LSSPIFEVLGGSLWREYIREVWHYLEQHYQVRTDDDFGTNVEILMHPCFTLQEAKRIAQACIWLEPAIEAVIPNPNNLVRTSSNWVQSGDFAPRGRFRPACINLIEVSATKGELAGLMQRDKPCVAYNWEFEDLTQPGRTIKFTRPPPTYNLNDAIRYPEFTLCFVRAAMQCSQEQLQRIPATVQGLRAGSCLNTDCPGFTANAPACRRCGVDSH
jgi:hypothetical protein